MSLLQSKINSIEAEVYAKVDLLNDQTITGTITCSNGLNVARGGGDGSLKVLPNEESTSDSSVGFFRNRDMSITNPGDVWVMGQNTYTVGAGNFAIGNNSVRAVSIKSNGDFTVDNGSITASGTITASGATFTGTITASGATFTGTVTGITQATTDSSNNDIILTHKAYFTHLCTYTYM